FSTRTRFDVSATRPAAIPLNDRKACAPNSANADVNPRANRPINRATLACMAATAATTAARNCCTCRFTVCAIDDVSPVVPLPIPANLSPTTLERNPDSAVITTHVSGQAEQTTTDFDST